MWILIKIKFSIKVSLMVILDRDKIMTELNKNNENLD